MKWKVRKLTDPLGIFLWALIDPNGQVETVYLDRDVARMVAKRLNAMRVAS